MKRAKWTTCAAVFALGLASPVGVFADQDDDSEQERRDWEDAERARQQQGPQGGQQGGQQGGPGGQENPLVKIIDMMREVEDRLFGADTGDFTQDEQRQIVEAMRFEDQTTQALEDLIRQIEEQQQQQSSSSSSSSSQQDSQQSQSDQNQSGQDQQQRSQSQQERDRQAEAQRQAQEQPQQQAGGQQEEQQNRPENGGESNQEQSREEQARAQERAGGQGSDQDPGRNARWGQLPRKLHQDAANAQNMDPPERWRTLIENYRTRIAESD